MMGSFEGKFYIFALFLYFVIWRILSNILQIVNTKNHLQQRPLLSESKLSQTVIIPKAHEKNKPPHMQMGKLKDTQSQLKNLTHQKKYSKGRGRLIKFRQKNFGNFDSWESDPGMKKVLLWTGYGPLQEGMMLWGRVLSDIVKGQCPESR